MASRPLAAASLGLAAAVGAAAGFLSYVDQFGANNLVGAPSSLDAAVQLMLLLLVAAAAMGAFNTAVALIYARLYNAGGGGGAAVDRRIPQVVYLVLFASFGVLHVFLVPQPDVIDGAQELLQPLAVAVAVAHVLLPTAAAATFFLSVTLIYAHVGAGGAGGAGGAVGDMAIPTTTVKLLTKLVLAAAIITVVLTLTATVVASYAD